MDRSQNPFPIILPHTAECSLPCFLKYNGFSVQRSLFLAPPKLHHPRIRTQPLVRTSPKTLIFSYPKILSPLSSKTLQNAAPHYQNHGLDSPKTHPPYFTQLNLALSNHLTSLTSYPRKFSVSIWPAPISQNLPWPHNSFLFSLRHSAMFRTASWASFLSRE